MFLDCNVIGLEITNKKIIEQAFKTRKSNSTPLNKPFIKKISQIKLDNI